MNQMPSGPFVGPFTVADTGFHRTIELKVICPSQWVINYPMLPMQDLSLMGTFNLTS